MRGRGGVGDGEESMRKNKEVKETEEQLIKTIFIVSSHQRFGMLLSFFIKMTSSVVCMCMYV